jgi:hypothetical protein
VVLLNQNQRFSNLVTYLNNVLLYVCLEGQFDSIYFDLSQEFDKVPYTLLLASFVIFYHLHFILSGSKATYQLATPSLLS